MEDKDIIDLYWQRSEKAIWETDKKYGRYCRYIALRILGNPMDAEEITDDIYLKVWSTVPPSRPQSLKAYLGMISRQLSFNAYEAQNTQKRGGGLDCIFEELSECIPDGNGGNELGESIALRDALNKFIASLPSKTRDIFVRRYWYSCSVSEIARELGVKENYVSVLLFNTRKKLKIFLNKEGFQV